jgi:hypothetical protein
MTVRVATVHWRDDRWIELQLNALERFLPRPYRLYAFLDEGSEAPRNRFLFSSAEPIRDHATKLNVLGSVASVDAPDDDVLVFIDGDAFPVGPIDRFVGDRLATHPLVAVQRTENNGDVQPHPCFCITTVGFWREIGGDWHGGHEWLDLQGKATSDVGGNLLGQLDRAGVEWTKLPRLNTVDPHPLFFGVYGDEEGPVVYHHGAGFRDPVSRIDLASPEARRTRRARAGRALDALPARLPLGRVRARYQPETRLPRSVVARNSALSAEWFERLQADPEAWSALIA